MARGKPVSKRFTEEEINKWRELRCAGYTCKEIADQYGLVASTINRHTYNSICEVTYALSCMWKNMYANGYSVKEIAKQYNVSPKLVARHTRKCTVRKTTIGDDDNIEPITEEEFRKRDIVPNRNIRGLSGKAMARLLELNRNG